MELWNYATWGNRHEDEKEIFPSFGGLAIRLTDVNRQMNCSLREMKNAGRGQKWRLCCKSSREHLDAAKLKVGKGTGWYKITVSKLSYHLLYYYYYYWYYYYYYYYYFLLLSTIYFIRSFVQTKIYSLWKKPHIKKVFLNRQ